MSIQLLDGTILIRDGSIATNSDCCCTPSCFPNFCLSDPRANKCQYYCDLSGDCKKINSFEINITGVTEAVTCVMSLFTTSELCCYTYDCDCDLFNATYIHEREGTTCSASTAFYSFFNLRPPGWNGLNATDDCNVPDVNEVGGACGPNQSYRVATFRTGFCNQQTSYSTGPVTNLVFPNSQTLFGDWQICNNYTLSPGHYIVTVLSHTVGIQQVFTSQKVFIYGFSNGAKRYVACGDDQFYPIENFIGGDSVLLASRRIWRTSSEPFTEITYTDCDDWEYTCQLKNATVTIEPPDIEACEVSAEEPI